MFNEMMNGVLNHNPTSFLTGSTDDPGKSPFSEFSYPNQTLTEQVLTFKPQSSMSEGIPGH